MKKQIDDILSQDMDRKEFFALVGAILLSVFGISNILKNLSSHSKKYTRYTMGYSNGAYGGRD